MAAGVLSRQLSPAILTYTTSRPSKNWLLGLTAASHGLPIVVAGLGRSAFGFGSTAPRVMGYLRALQIMDSAAPGSIAVGLAGVAQGVQLLSVHDVAETAQALRLWQATR